MLNKKHAYEKKKLNEKNGEIVKMNLKKKNTETFFSYYRIDD